VNMQRHAFDKGFCKECPRQRNTADQDGESLYLGGDDADHALFDHTIDSGKQCRRHLNSQSLGGFQVDHQLKFGRLLDRQISRFRAAEDFDSFAGSSILAKAKLSGARSLRNHFPRFLAIDTLLEGPTSQRAS
jgi:hypothetical protein